MGDFIQRGLEIAAMFGWCFLAVLFVLCLMPN